MRMQLTFCNDVGRRPWPFLESPPQQRRLPTPRSSPSVTGCAKTARRRNQPAGSRDLAAAHQPLQLAVQWQKNPNCKNNDCLNTQMVLVTKAESDGRWTMQTHVPLCSRFVADRTQPTRCGRGADLITFWLSAA